MRGPIEDGYTQSVLRTALREYRRAMGGGAQLARAIGVSRGYIQSREELRTPVRLDDIVRCVSWLEERGSPGHPETRWPHGLPTSFGPRPPAGEPGEAAWCLRVALAIMYDAELIERKRHEDADAERCKAGSGEDWDDVPF